MSPLWLFLYCSGFVGRWCGGWNCAWLHGWGRGVCEGAHHFRIFGPKFACRDGPSQVFRVRPPHPLPPLQRLMEIFVKLHLSQTQEGRGEGSFLSVLFSKPQSDTECLLD